MSTCFGSLTSQSVMRSWNCEAPFEPFCTSTLGLSLPRGVDRHQARDRIGLAGRELRAAHAAQQPLVRLEAAPGNFEGIGPWPPSVRGARACARSSTTSTRSSSARVTKATRLPSGESAGAAKSVSAEKSAMLGIAYAPGRCAQRNRQHGADSAASSCSHHRSLPGRPNYCRLARSPAIVASARSADKLAGSSPSSSTARSTTPGAQNSGEIISMANKRAR